MENASLSQLEDRFKEEIETELDKQCGMGYDWSPRTGQCVPSTGGGLTDDEEEIEALKEEWRLRKERGGKVRPSSDDEVEVITVKSDSGDEEDFEIDPDQDLSDEDNDVKCPRNWNWSGFEGRCKPPRSRCPMNRR